MAAQDVDTRTKAEIEAAAMNALIDVLGGDDDSNIAKTLDAHKIKDPSLIICPVAFVFCQHTTSHQ